MAKKKFSKPHTNIIVRHGKRFHVSSISGDKKFLNVRRIVGNTVQRKHRRIRN